MASKSEGRSKVEECPKCRTTFTVKDHLKYRVGFDLATVKLLSRNQMFEPNPDESVVKPDLVVCPECGNEFATDNYRVFGFIRVKHFRIGLMTMFWVQFAGVLALLIWRMAR